MKFFDSNPKFRSSQIDSFARTWAENADEYLCWDLVPKEALINFVPFDELSTGCLSIRDIGYGAIPDSNFELYDNNGPYCA